eukprot:2584340-Amphidinium_carterae.1
MTELHRSDLLCFLKILDTGIAAWSLWFAWFDGSGSCSHGTCYSMNITQVISPGDIASFSAFQHLWGNSTKDANVWHVPFACAIALL